MGIFKSIKELRGVAKQAKDLRAMQLKDAGYEPNVRGSLDQLGDLLAQANTQLEGLASSEQERAQALAGGVAGEATIVSTGVPPRSATLFNLMIDLEVRVPGWEPYRVASMYMVPRGAQFAVGVVLPVRVDPDDRAKIAIDWNNAAKQPKLGEIRPAD